MQPSALLQSRATRSEVARCRCSWLIGKGSCVLGKARAPGDCTPPPRPHVNRHRRSRPRTPCSHSSPRTRSDVVRTHLDHAVAHPAGQRVVALPAQVATLERARNNLPLDTPQHRRAVPHSSLAPAPFCVHVAVAERDQPVASAILLEEDVPRHTRAPTLPCKADHTD